MRLRIVALLVAASSLPAGLGSAAAAPPTGCFERVYSDAHMRANPQQVVRRLVISLGWSDYSMQNEFGFRVWLRGKKQLWAAGGPCEAQAGTWVCQPDTDGAPKVFASGKGDALEFSKPGRLKVIDDATGPDLNDELIGGPANTTFRLTRTSAAKCEMD